MENLYNLTNPQKSIWLTEQYYKGSNINNICGSLTIKQPLDFEKFKQAIQLFVENNSSFRICLKMDNNEIKQYVKDFSYFDIDIIDLKDEKSVKEYEHYLASLPLFDFDKLLFKFVIFRLPNGYGGFIINTHHIISDSWSLGITVNEIINYYSSLLKNTKYEQKKYSYMDFCKSEQEYLLSSRFEKDKEYWSTVYETVPDTVSIPTLKNLDSNSISANRITHTINGSLFTQIQSYCKSQKISIYNFLIAIYSIYISRVCNSNDFVIGTPILNRSNYIEKQTTGMFIDTLPFRISVNSEVSFSDFLAKISKDSMALLRHQKYSYQYIIEDLRKRNSSQPTLYNILMSYQITKMNEKMEEIPHNSDWTFNDTMSDDLDIHIFDFNDTNSLNISYDYKTNMYDENYINSMHKRILHIISQVTSTPNMLISQIDIVTPYEKKQILFDFNNTKTQYPKDKTVAELFEEQVRLSPSKNAVFFEGNYMTYKELNEKANQLANILLKNNVKSGNVVSLFMEKSIESIIAILATLKIGAAFLPLDVEYPKERIDYILSNSETKLILTTKNFENGIITNIPKLCVDLSNKKIYNNSVSKANLNIIGLPEDMAYIMYTSGSTGSPKGVIVCNRNIVRLVKNNKFIKFENDEHILQTGSIVFDACTFEIWGALLNGFSLYLIPKEKLLDVKYLEKYLVENKITILWLTASLGNYICDQSPNIFKNVHYLLTGGDVLSVKHIKKMQEANPNLTIINGYGPTENTTFSACYKIDKNLTDASIPIGYPISNSTCYIVSSTGNLQPVGIPGELWVGGDGVSLGYLHRDDLTKKNFIKNPFADGRMYKTGDLARFLDDGKIEFLGRIDNQIKIRGFRVELSEINDKIMQYSGIKQAYTIFKKTDITSTICSYITVSNKVDIKDLYMFLKSSLPNYMIPAHITILDKFPLNINGKVDKKALPEPTTNHLNKIVPPRNDIDKIIIEELKNILNCTDISIEDSFFDLGGDSLVAINLSIALSNKLKTNVSVKTILNTPIVANLSDTISNEKHVENNINHIKHIEKQDYYPTSSAQKRIYYACEMAGNLSTSYNVPGGIVFDKCPDLKKLENAFNKLIEKHSALRTYFGIENGELVQKIVDKIHISIDLEKSENTTCDKLFNEFVKPFNLNEAPLFRVKLACIENNKVMLLLDIHHIINDGASLDILLNDLCKLYSGKTLEFNEYDYKDYSIWENEQINSDKLKEDENYWISKWKDKEIPLLNMPTVHQRPTVLSHKGKNSYYKFSPELTANIFKICKKYHITPFMLLLSAYYATIYKYSGQEDIVVGSPVLGRDQKELKNIVGMFVNTLPLDAHIDGSMSFIDLCDNVKNNCMEAFSHQTYPFDLIVKNLDIKRDSSRNPLFDVMFVYQNKTQSSFKLSEDINSQLYYPDFHSSKFDITLEITPLDDYLYLHFEYSTDLFDEDYISRFETHYQKLIEEILSNVNINIRDINIITKTEENKLLKSFNDTSVKYDKNKLLITYFEDQVKQNPNKTAIIFNDKEISYDNLNKLSNKIANYLISCNVKENDVVSILLDRNEMLIASMIGVLKAGAAYLLIDKSLPHDRIEYMLNDSKTVLLITNTQLDKFDVTNKLIINDLENTAYLSKLNNISDKNPSCRGNNEDMFNIIYTSGSTGNPKGVALRRLGIINMILSYKNILHTDDCNVFLSMSAVSFDMFIVENFVSLFTGKTVVLCNDEEQKIPVYTNNLIKKYDVNFILTTPTRINLLLSSISDISNWKSVKVVQVGGEVFTSELYNHLRQYSNAHIYNGYGPSEFTACCCNKEIIDGSNVSIGTPFCNTKIYILDDNHCLCPIGIPGEICVVGDGIAKGYLNRPDLTNKVFVPSPFDNGKMYKTGDIGKWLPNGEIEYIGRRDFQIKIRGLRVELSEIEKKLQTYPDIKNCSVVYIKDVQDPYIAAFFTANTTLDISQIRLSLSKSLPLYMVPKYIVQLDELPMNNNGKVDKKALQQYKIDNKDEKTYVKPSNDTEKLFCKIWESLLNTKVGIDNDVFELGADSLFAIKFKTELLSHNIDLPYATIFKYTTVRQLADYYLKKIKLAENNFDDANSIDTEDYSEINNLLSKNTITNINKFMPNLVQSKNNNILLLGGNGFVGAHILNEFIKNDSGTAYCIIRNKNGEDAKNRFANILHFYFGNSLDKFIGNRIKIITGSLTEHHFGLSDKVYNNIISNIEVVINAAAMVKHYGSNEKFKAINVDLTKNLIEFCKKYNKRLLHTSSISVSGTSSIDRSYAYRTSNDNQFSFAENNLYVGQQLDNLYIKSKFDAEKNILSQIQNGLKAQILRLGNITNRYNDGKFQINATENAFLNRIVTFIKLGYIPEELSNTLLEFTPVDICAKAIITVLQNYVPDFTVFHVYNSNYITMNTLINYFKDRLIHINLINSDLFSQNIKKLLKTDNKKDILSGIINDIDANYKIQYSFEIPTISEFSKYFLYKFGFTWPEIDENYIEKYINYIKEQKII